DAVRWFCEAGVPEARPGMNAYWRSLACRAWAAAAGAGGGFPGPVHLDLALREPLVPPLADAAGRGGGAGGLARAAERPPGRRAVAPRRRRRRARRSAGPALDRARGDRLR